MDGLPSLGWGNALHRGNVLHFHPQHIPGMDTAGALPLGSGRKSPHRAAGAVRHIRPAPPFPSGNPPAMAAPSRWRLLNPIIAVKGVKRLVTVPSCAPWRPRPACPAGTPRQFHPTPPQKCPRCRTGNTA